MAWKEKHGKVHRVVDRGPDGMKVVLATYDRAEEARKHVTLVKADKLRGVPWIDPRAGEVSVETYAWETYVPTKAAVRPSTLDNIKGRLRTHLLPAFGAMRLKDVQHTDILRWQAASSTARGEAGHATINSALGTLRQLFEVAKRDYAIPENPCKGVTPLPVSERRRRVIHPLMAEQVQIFAHTIDPRFRAFVLFSAFGTGARPGECWALGRDKVDLMRREIRIDESADEGVVGPTKTGQARTVRMEPETADLLAEHMERFPSKNGFVFTSPEGEIVRHRNFLARFFDPARNEVAHLMPKDLVCYDLRHTHASLMFALGMRAEEVSARLGNDVRTTRKWYLHLYEGHDDSTLERLSEIVRAASAPTVPPREASLLPFEGHAGL